MKKQKILIGILAAFIFIAAAYADGAVWIFSYKPASANYALYSGTLSESTAPTGKRKNISFEISGNAAKDMFDNIGPDIKSSCVASEKERVRERGDGNIRCHLHLKNNYQCYFGINFQSGKIIPGEIC